MSFLKFTALLAFGAMGASAATIVSGSITILQPNYTTSLSLLLSDGVTVNSGGSYDFFSFQDVNPCYDTGSGCYVNAPTMMGFGNTNPGFYYGSFNLSYGNSYLAFNGSNPTTFQTTVSINGAVGYNTFGGLACPFTDSFSGCSVSFAGTGTVQENITSMLVGSSPGTAAQAFYVSKSVYAISQTPEPASLCLPILPLILLGWRHAARNQLRTVAVANGTLPSE